MTTKTFIFGISVLMFTNAVLIAQNDSLETKREYVAYTMFYNVVPDQFNYPLIGFVNVANGNHKGAQLGFVNTTLKDHKGLKAGFVNTTRGNSSGVHLGFLNTTIGNFSGMQLGFVNTSLKESKSLQTGFINTIRGNSKGSQIGFINTILGNYSGLQMSFVNTTTENVRGAQLGFVNIARKGINGSQFGFVNIADSVSNGVPFGLISIVKKGGYRAVEISVSELYPANLTFKIGVPKFYSFFQGSYNSNYSNSFAMGLGFGSLIPMGSKFYFNPEIGNTSTFEGNSNTSVLVTNIRYSISSKFQIAAGPSVVWYNYTQGLSTYDPPFYALLNDEINTRNRLLLGVRVALSFNFTDL